MRLVPHIAVPILVILVLAAAGRATAQPRLVSRNLTAEEGLPSNYARSILQDRLGFVWIGTQGGLVRYDGRDMVVHLPVEGDSTSICGRMVSQLAEDREGRLWIGTIINGLCRYDPVTERFTRLSGAADDSTRVPADWIIGLSIAPNGQVWVVAREHGIYRVAPATGRAERVVPGPHWPGTPRQIGATHVMADDRGRIWFTTARGGAHVMEADGRPLEILPEPVARADGGLLVSARHVRQGPGGRIWISGDGGIVSWDPATRRQERYLPDPFGDAAGTGFNFVGSTTQDAAGTVWGACEGGLLSLDPRFGRFTFFRHDPADAVSITSGPVLCVASDDAGNVWAGHWGTGVSCFDPAGSPFEVRRHDPKVPGSLDADQVMAVTEDAQGTLWVGTGREVSGGPLGGLNRLRRDGRGFDHFPLPEPSLFAVQAIAAAGDDRLWLGLNDGLWRFDPATGGYTRNRPHDPALGDLQHASITTVMVDDDRSVWVGTREHGAWRLGADGTLAGRYTYDPADDRSLRANNPMVFWREDRDRLWVGTGTGGLHRWVPESDDFVRYFNPQRGLTTVTAIAAAGDGQLWAGSYAGLLRVDPEAGIVTSVDVGDGLPNDRISNLMPDRQGRLWLSTNRGLTLFDPADGSLRNFDRRAGLPANAAAIGMCRDAGGRIHVATRSGLVSFAPERFTPSTYAPNVVVTGLSVQDQPLRPGPGSPLPASIVTGPAVTLPHDRNTVTFAFAGLDLGHPELLRYRFRLRDLESDWRPSGAAAEAAYTNLPPGRYTFEVQGTNRDGVWSPRIATVPLTITHPWWSAPLTRVVYVVLFVAALAGSYLLLMRRLRHREALRLRLAEVEKLEELDRVKSRFFANISHEFRTPLTLIEGLLHRLHARPQSFTPESYDMVMRNTRRLRELIDQLLDLTRLQSGRFQLKWHQDDVLHFTRALCSTFDFAAEARRITFTTELPDDPIRGWFDRGVLESIITNLVSNALKYAPDGAEVRLSLSVASERELAPAVRNRIGLNGAARCRDLTVRVANTGSYIPAADRDLVFDRFFQAAAAGDDGNVGTGIGLALVRELVEFLGGSAEVASTEGEGTVFTVVMPLIATPPESGAASNIPAGAPETDVLSRREERRRRLLADGDESGPEVPAPESVGAGTEPGAAGEPGDLPLLLVVEDHADLRSFLASELESGYRIVTARDGEDGWDRALEQVPDVIVSDVMMPRLDGFELLARLRKTDATSHIPVVLLTARSEAESRKEGLRGGADDYLAKPVDPEELRIRIDNLVRQREALRRKYSRGVATLPVRELPLATREDRFLARAITIVQENMEDEDFSVEDLAREVGLSRAQLHRKLKALTGEPATALIRRQRLRHAAELLRSGYGNVSEVAFAAGFRSLSHFSRNFKEEFGVPPSEYGGDSS